MKKFLWRKNKEEDMGNSIDVTENITECLKIIDDYITKGDDGEFDKETAENAISYLKITTNNAVSGAYEPRGCPNQNRMEKVK